MLRKAEIDAARPAKPGTTPPPGKPPLSLGDLPRECMTVLDAGGGPPTIALDGTVPAALKAAAAKDAGPPAPHLDAAALEALKARMAASKPGSKPAPDAAKPVPDAAKPGADAASASAAESVPLPDRKPH
jgi:hypothetical protein